MDIAADILRLGEKVALVPELSVACKLTMQIIQTVQTSKRHIIRLQELTHQVAKSLITIADHMEGRWDLPPPMLKTKLDEFEAILQDVLKVAERQGSSSHFKAIFTAGYRDHDIAMLGRRLFESQRSISLLSGVDYSAVPMSAPELDDPEIRIYTRDDLRLLQKISQYELHLRAYPDSSRRPVTVQLHKVKRRDNRVFLVRSYHDVHSAWQRNVFEQDLLLRSRILDPSIVQLIGASRSTASIPFQVFHMPGDQVEILEDWLKRTLSSNPVETIYGLYDMRTSVMALTDFKQLPSSPSTLIEGLCVGVQTEHDRPHWRMVYGGELPSPERGSSLSVRHVYKCMSIPFPRYGSPDPATSMGNMLCHSPAWTRSSEDLIDILRCRYEDITLPMLGAAFFERGWLAPNVLGIHPIDTLTLGDIGYVNETGNFVVIDNLRHSIQARSGPLFWSEYLQVQSRPEDIVNTPSEEILSSTGKSYQRRRLRPLTIPTHEDMCVSFKYENLDERHAWKVLQQHADAIITRQGLSIGAHELSLVIRIFRDWRTSLDIPGSESPHKHFDTGDNPPFQWVSPRSHGEGGMNPTLYLFSNGDIPNIRNNDNSNNLGALPPPGLTTKLRTSFEPNPKWLDNSTWHDNRDGGLSSSKTAEYNLIDASTSEMQNGLRLRSIENDPFIRCLQLPIGAARPG